MKFLFRDIYHRVNVGLDCWAWQIQSAAYLINNNSSNSTATTTNNEAVNILRACQADIVDLFPADQKLLTEMVWDCVKSANITGNHNAMKYLFNVVILTVL